tara:strand:+ start:202 stop:522 length:321 start_codon:yes stop_codon:yes gene_type:complete
MTVEKLRREALEILSLEVESTPQERKWCREFLADNPVRPKQLRSEEQKERKRAKERKGLYSREEKARLKAIKEEQMAKFEARRSPEVVWTRLLNGQQFNDVKFKTR